MISTNRLTLRAVSLLMFLGFFSSISTAQNKITKDSPKIINIVNFIRQTDYRVKDADSLLFDATEKQVALLNQYDFPGTFLLQYDAMINPKYQQLLTRDLGADSEIGAWWEITKPHVEAAGITWRGKHAWVSTANIAFTTGYTPAEREKLVDVYMAKFKSIFGYYPKSVGSWFIDAHTLGYMYEKYGIVASSNCKDQVGTDGYTLWGGYWNQAYYPSKKNAYMPAQTKENQIPVPIFRMLGSDPMYQYDMGVGTSRQGVISLEPVYKDAGMDKDWVDYFFESIVNQPSLAFNYAQAGQENSFTWDEMKTGLQMQFPILDSLRKNGKVNIVTMKSAGEWYKKEFPLTPATAVTTLQDHRHQENKSVWYNSRYYRANLFFQKDAFRFRDIHLFDENFQSEYLTSPGTGGQFYYFTLPLVDGFFWSTQQEFAGLRLLKIDEHGGREELVLKEPQVHELAKDVLQVSSLDQYGNVFKIVFKEGEIQVSCEQSSASYNWVLALSVPAERLQELPFQAINSTNINAEFRNHRYQVNLKKGIIKEGQPKESVIDLIPEQHRLIINTKVVK